MYPELRNDIPNHCLLCETYPRVVPSSICNIVVTNYSISRYAL